MAVGALGYAYAQGGMRDQAMEILGELRTLSTTRYVSAASLAIIHGALGDLDQAFDELVRAYEDRDLLLVHVENYSFFDPLRSDRRFTDLRNQALPTT